MDRKAQKVLYLFIFFFFNSNQICESPEEITIQICFEYMIKAIFAF